MHFQHSDWFTQSRLSAHILQFDLIWKTTKFLSDKATEKSRFREVSTDETTQKKNGKCHTGSVLNCLKETDQTTATIKTYIKLSKLEANSLQKFYHTKGLSGINRHPGGGLPYERGGDARRLAQGVIFGFWSHLECSGQNAIIFSRKGLFQGCKRRNVKKLYSFNLFYLLDSCNQSLLGVKKGWASSRLVSSKVPTNIPAPFIWEFPRDRQPSKAQILTVNRRPSKKLFFIVNC